MKVVMTTVRIRCLYGGEKVKDQNVDEAHKKNGKVYSNGVGCCISKRRVYNFQR